MKEAPTVFISHTTRDKRDHALAQHLATGLRDRGSHVWIAPHNIPIGSEWEPRIISAILSECSHFLVIISAASTGTAWVLKEIGLAQERRKADPSFTVLPLVVGTHGEFDGSDFISRFQRVPYFDDIAEQIDAVAMCLSLRPELPSRVAELTKDFVGREYVFSAIDKFVSSNDRGYFTLVGDPGEGKSAILAELVSRKCCVFHFNVRADGINTVEHCVRTINTQVCSRFGLSLQTPSDPSELGKHWTDLLQQASKRLAGDQRLMIAIDALDEVDLPGHPRGANVLMLPRVLPRGIHVVLTRRRVDLPFVVNAPQQVCDLLDYRDQSRHDIRTFINKALTRPKLATLISSQRIDSAKFTNVLAEKSEHNFMYLHYVLPEIENGSYQALDIDHLPEGLRGFYEDHWERMGMRDDPVPRDKIRIVYVMAEVRRPVSRSLIAAFAGEDAVLVQKVIDNWRQFLHEQQVDGESRYSLYHTSFLDFLHDKAIVRAAGESIENIHAAISDDLWQELMRQ